MLWSILKSGLATARERVAGTALVLLLVASALAVTATPAAARYAAIVVDTATGRVLFARNADTRNYPASLTKMMTIYMVFDAVENGRLTFGQRLKVSRRAAGQAPSKLGLKAGETIRVDHAVMALVTKSANDVATVVAEALGGTEAKFARLMTKKARQLGMTRTTFRNASGLPNRRQLSTARDMARLAVALQRDFPGYYHHFSRRSFTWRGRTYSNHNRLLANYQGADGMKTGYIRASGFNLVASAKRGDVRLIGVVFGGRSARSRNQHMRSLLDLGFKRTQSRTQMAALEPLTPKMRLYPLPRRFRAVPVPALERGEVRLAAATTAPRPTLPRLYRLPRRFKRVPLPALRPGTPPFEVAQAQLSGDWAVQVGAYAREAAAAAYLRRLSGHLPHLFKTRTSNIDKIDGDGGTLYRARFIDLNEAGAQRLCQALNRRSLTCVAVPPTKASLTGSPLQG